MSGLSQNIEKLNKVREIDKYFKIVKELAWYALSIRIHDLTPCDSLRLLRNQTKLTKNIYHAKNIACHNCLPQEVPASI